MGEVGPACTARVPSDSPPCGGHATGMGEVSTVAPAEIPGHYPLPVQYSMTRPTR